MKLKFQFFYRTVLLVFILVLCFAWFTQAQNESRATAGAGTGPATDAWFSWPNGGELTFGLDRIAIFTPEWFGFPIWQYLATSVFVALAFYLSRFIGFIIRSRLRAWAQKTETKLDDLILDLMHGPIKLMTFVAFLYIGLGVFHWGAGEMYIQKGLDFGVIVSITYMLLKLVDVAMGYWRHKSASEGNKLFEQQLYPIMRKSIKIFVLVAAGLFVIQNVFGKQITGILASLSVVGLAVSLAGQDTLANVFGAIVVFVDKPFQIGDMIQIESNTGLVESIGLRSTRIRNLDGHLITIPNKTMGNASITNITLRPNIKTVMNFGLTYDTSGAKVREALKILEDIYRGNPMTSDLQIAFNKFEASSLNIMVVHWWRSTDMNAYLKGMQEINLSIKEQFEQAGIQFAFPSQTLYVKQP